MSLLAEHSVYCVMDHSMSIGVFVDSGKVHTPYCILHSTTEYVVSNNVYRSFKKCIRSTLVYPPVLHQKQPFAENTVDDPVTMISICGSQLITVGLSIHGNRERLGHLICADVMLPLSRCRMIDFTSRRLLDAEDVVI